MIILLPDTGHIVLFDDTVEKLPFKLSVFGFIQTHAKRTVEWDDGVKHDDHICVVGGNSEAVELNKLFKSK